jgi:DNA-directed RNA polymerase specialized sigma24 family protein
MAEETTDELPSLHWRELNALLEYWGRARWRVGLSGGFPEQSTSVGRVELYEPRDWFQVSQLTAQGKQNPYYGGHRILSECCWYVSPTLLAVNKAVNLLPEPQFQAIAVNFAIGAVYAREFSAKEKAEVLGTTVDAMNERLRRARKALGRMLVNYRYEAQLRGRAKLSEH